MSCPHRGLAVRTIQVLALALSAAAPAHAAGPITIGEGTGPASPYPSTFEVRTASPFVEDVDVRIENLDHPLPDELDILVVGPGGQAVSLISDVGARNSVCIPDLRFSDQATVPVPAGDLPCDGTYLPTDDDSDPLDLDVFPAPAPAASFGSSLAVFNSLDPNGIWSLYVVDDTLDDGGSIGEWWPRVETRPPGLVRLPLQMRVSERQGAVSLRVRRSGGSAEAPLRAGSVSWTAGPCPEAPPSGVLAGWDPGVAATADQDFTPAQGTLALAPAETEKTIGITLTDDRVPEGIECFAVRLGGPSGDTALGLNPSGNPPVAYVSISDDDPRASAPSVKARGPQRVLRNKAVIVTATSRTDGTLTATGTIPLPPRAAAALRLKPATANVTAGQPVALRLGLAKKARRAIKRILARKRALTAKVKVTATDLGGGRATKTLRVKLRRR